ncbi:MULTISPECIES: hypothetical protein [unclassified Streptococcus]|nr:MULTISPECIES: hypothetical protein [unclassified Streptococcus]
MKNTYTSPLVEVVTFDQNDIVVNLATSGETIGEVQLEGDEE